MVLFDPCLSYLTALPGVADAGLTIGHLVDGLIDSPHQLHVGSVEMELLFSKTQGSPGLA